MICIARHIVGLTIVNGIICIFGDLLVDWNSDSRLAKAISDNGTHACVGLVTALAIILEMNRKISTTEKINLIVVCFLVSSLIDLDHFIAAKSWKLANATSLKQRPFLHCTTIPLVLLLMLYPIEKYFRSFRINIWLSMFICALLSHQTRDATRRGYWIYPLGHTKPLPYFVYILCIQVIPFCFIYLLNDGLDSGHQLRYHYTNFTI